MAQQQQYSYGYGYGYAPGTVGYGVQVPNYGVAAATPARPPVQPTYQQTTAFTPPKSSTAAVHPHQQQPGTLHRTQVPSLQICVSLQ